MTGVAALSLVPCPTSAPRAALQFVSLGAKPKLSRSVLLAVVLLHAALIHLLVTGMRHTAPDFSPRPFTVEWIAERPVAPELPVPPWPDLPSRSRAGDVAAQPEVSPSDPEAASTVSNTVAPRWDLTQPQLFDGEGRPRLEADRTAPTWTDYDRIRRDRIVKLPGGSDAQAAYQVRLRMHAARSPQSIVQSVLRLLFGRPAVDDCRTIEQRLINGDPGVTREIDLAKLRRTCVGKP